MDGIPDEPPEVVLDADSLSLGKGAEMAVQLRFEVEIHGHPVLRLLRAHPTRGESLGGPRRHLGGPGSRRPEHGAASLRIL